MLIDTHAHINFNAYKDDGDEVIKRALDQGVWLINVGSQWETSQRAVEYAQKYSAGVYAAVGLHPIYLEDIEVDEEELGDLKFKTKKEEFNFERYLELAKNSKVKAIGEIGLDYKTPNVILTLSQAKGGSRAFASLPPKGKNPERVRAGSFPPLFAQARKRGGQDDIKERQKEVFERQIELAQQMNLPIIFHCREAYDDLIEILKNFQKKCAGCLFSCPGAGSASLKGVIHCFCGDLTTAEKFLEMGFYLGFNGLITFSGQYDEIIRQLPLEKICLETDCPYLAPVPHRGKRNEPAYVKLVAEKISQIKEVSFDEIADQTTKNAKELFEL